MRTYKKPCGYGARHVKYRMTCDEFLALIEHSGGRCGICSKEADVRELQIDHDHAVGAGAVRGLLCGPCNTRLMVVEKGRREMTSEQARYLAEPWHVTGSGWVERRSRYGRRAGRSN